MDSTKRNINTLLCDLGNVILFFSYDKMIGQIAKATKLDDQAVRHLLFDKSLAVAYERGEIDSLSLYRKIISLCEGAPSYAEFFYAVSDIFTPNEEIYPILHALKEKKIKLILLSNTCPAHFEFARKNFPILDLFDEFVLSYRVKALKPEKAIYDHALSLAQCAPEKCLYIDDIPEFTNAAQKLGIHAITFTNTHALSNDLQLLI